MQPIIALLEHWTLDIAIPNLLAAKTVTGLLARIASPPKITGSPPYYILTPILDSVARGVL
jgi:hypothetical protein